jgi:hypothetical protein
MSKISRRALTAEESSFPRELYSRFVRFLEYTLGLPDV